MEPIPAAKAAPTWAMLGAGSAAGWDIMEEIAGTTPRQEAKAQAKGMQEESQETKASPKAKARDTQEVTVKAKAVQEESQEIKAKARAKEANMEARKAQERASGTRMAWTGMKQQTEHNGTIGTIQAGKRQTSKVNNGRNHRMMPISVVWTCVRWIWDHGSPGM